MNFTSSRRTSLSDEQRFLLKKSRSMASLIAAALVLAHLLTVPILKDAYERSGNDVSGARFYLAIFAAAAYLIAWNLHVRRRVTAGRKPLSDAFLSTLLPLAYLSVLSLYMLCLFAPLLYCLAY